MPYPLPLTRTEAYLAYKAGVIQQSDLKPSLAVPRNGIDAWLAYWTGLTTTYPVKNVGKNLFNKNTDVLNGNYYLPGNASSTRIVTAISSTMTRTLLIRLQEGQTYTIQKKASARFRFGFTTTDNPAPNTDGVITSRLAGADTASSFTFTVPNGSPYFVCNFFSDDQAADAQNGYDTIVNSVQIEEGSTATAYEPYTGEPLILQEEEAYIAYLSGVINEYPEKCLRRVGAYLRYLISARWGRPDHPLNREELYLSLIKTQFIPSGDPSSDIVIDGTAKAAFVDVKMYGDTFQQSYTGKNIFTTGNFDYTNGGIRSIGSNGVINSSGTLSQTWGFNIYGGKNLIPSGIIPAGTYTVSITKAVVFPFILGLVAEDNTTTIGNYTIPAGSTSYTFTTDQPAKYFTLWSNYANHMGEQISVTGLSIMVESGSSATTYEPYVGGTASPNPDYPQAIQTVTGEQTVTVVGKNLVGATEQRYTNQGITTTMNSDGTITCKGTCAQAYFGITKQTSGGGIAEATPCNIPAGTYTLSLTNATDQFGVTLRLYASTTATDYKQVVVTKGNSSNTVTLTSPAVMFYIWGSSTTVGQEIDETIGIQFEPGSAATPFAPFSKQTYEINLGKNLFDKSKQVSGWLNSTGGISQPTSTTDKTSDYMTCSPNTSYTLSSSGYYLKIAQYDANKAFIKLDQSGNNIPSLTVNTDGNAAYIRISYGNADKEPNVQFEAGSAATPYAPYFAPIELCKLGTYQDYIYKDGEEWKLHKATNKVTLTGAEHWQFPNVGDSATFFQLRNSSWQSAFGDDTLAPTPGTNVSVDPSFFKSTKFVGISAMDANMKTYQGIGKKGEWFRISLLNTWNVSTVEQLQTWLGQNNTQVAYVLDTPTDTVITNQNLINQLEALVNGGAENGTTYIKVNATDPNLPGLLYVEAPKYE